MVYEGSGAWGRLQHISADHDHTISQKQNTANLFGRVAFIETEFLISGGCASLKQYAYVRLRLRHVRYAV